MHTCSLFIRQQTSGSRIRTFLIGITGLLLLLGTTAVHLSGSGQAAAPTVGLELYSLRDQFAKDVPGTMAIVKQMGFTEVEVAGFYGMNARQFRTLLDKHDLKATSVGFGYDFLRDSLDRAIADAKTLGAQYIMCAWIPHNGDNFTKADAQKAVKDFNAWGAKLKAAGIQFCYHTHGYEFVRDGAGTLFDYIATQTKPDQVQFEMDIFWVKHGGQDPVQLLRKYPNRFALMHLKDMQKGLQGNLTGHAPLETSVALGTGMLDIPAIMREAQRTGVKHYYIEDEAPDVMEQIPQSLAFLKTIK